MRCFVLAMVVSILWPYGPLAGEHPPAMHAEILLQSRASWDGAPYTAYPAGQPELSVLKLTIPYRSNIRRVASRVCSGSVNGVTCICGNSSCTVPAPLCAGSG